MEINKPVRIFLDMPSDSPLAQVIKETMPSIGDQPTHVYVDTAEGADIICDIEFIQTVGLEGLVGKLNEKRGGNPLSVTLGQVLDVEEASN